MLVFADILIAATLKNDLSRALSDRRAEIGTQPDSPQKWVFGEIQKKMMATLSQTLRLQYYLPKMVFENYNKLYNIKRKGYYRKPRKS